MPDTQQKPLTLAQIAKLVKRGVPILKDGKPTGNIKYIAIPANEILAHVEHDTYVSVVTVDGHKFRGNK